MLKGLGGLGGLGDMAKMMKSAQDLQTKMTEMQEELNNMMVVGESGAGLVKATATAKGELKGLDIDPSIFNGDDKEVVEDLILAAIKDAQTMYEWPQENGNKSDTRWAKVWSDQANVGLEARVTSAFNFSLREYSIDELERAEHPHELRKGDEHWLNIDFAQHGLGSGSCGPQPFEGSRLRSGPFEFSASLRVVEKE